MSTEKLFYEDQYLRRFTARVLSCRRSDNGWETVLDRTAFYPEGGGQAGDRGTLGGVEVLDTRYDNDEIVHFCSGPLTSGAQVTGEIDWQRRFDLMQQHSGEHIVSGLIHQRFGFDNVGFHMGSAVTVIDFNGELSPGDIALVERAANEKIWEDVPISAQWPCDEELKGIPYRSKKALTGPVRIVTIPGADICACCGTHTARTGEIGLIKMLSCQRLRHGSRIELLCGARAYDYVCGITEQNRLNSMLLSAKPLETAAAAEKLASELERTRFRLAETRDQLFAAQAQELKGTGDTLLFRDDLPPDELRRLCDAVMHTCEGRCAVFSGTDDEGYRYAAGTLSGDILPLIKNMNAALNGRGGGKNALAQGSVACTRADIESFFASL